MQYFLDFGQEPTKSEKRTAGVLTVVNCQDGGVAVIIGLVDSQHLVSFHPSSLLLGKTWTSGVFGGFKARTHLPELVEKFIAGVSCGPSILLCLCVVICLLELH